MIYMLHDLRSQHALYQGAGSLGRCPLGKPIALRQEAGRFLCRVACRSAIKSLNQLAAKFTPTLVKVSLHFVSFLGFFIVEHSSLLKLASPSCSVSQRFPPVPSP